MTLFLPLAFLAGLIAHQHWSLPWWVAAPPVGVGAALLVCSRRPWQIILALSSLALGLAFLIGDLQRTTTPKPLTQAMAVQTIVAVRGVVIDQPVPRERTQQLRLRVDAIRLERGEWRTVGGIAQLTARPLPAFDYGDVLEVRGTPEPPETVSPAGYGVALRRRGVEAVLGFPTIIPLGREVGDPKLRWLFGWRERLAVAIERALPEPHAALSSGILLGRRTTLPRELVEQLSRSGTSHIVAVSGFNVSVVVAFAIALLGPSWSVHPRRRAFTTLLASLMLWGFVALVGSSGSVLRAAAMSQLALIGRATGRTGTAGAMLLWGSAFLAAWDPALLTDVGWQLSFLGTAGLIWLSPAIARPLVWLPAMVREALSMTLAAQIFVFPILISTFGNVSLIAPLTNVLVLPLIPPIMLGTFALILAGLLFPPAAPLFASLTWVPTSALLHVVEWAAGVPGAAAPFPPLGIPGTAGYLTVLVLLCVWNEARALTQPAERAPTAPREGSRLTRIAIPALLALFCIGVAMAAPTGIGAAEPALSVSIPAISDGVLALAQSPSGERVLLNGGPGTSSATALVGQYLRPWDRIVDLAVATDPREAYVLGLPRVLERYRTGVLLDSTAEYASAAHRHLRDTARRHQVARNVPQPGTEYVVGRTLRVEILGEPDVAGSAPATMTAPRSTSGGAAATLSLRLRWGTFSLLVPGDLSPAEHRRLLGGAQALKSTAVLLTARATRDPNTAALLRAAEPELVIIQGELRAAPGAASPPPLQPVPLGGDMPEPTWHFTAQGGSVRLEVSHGDYRIIRQ